MIDVRCVGLIYGMEVADPDRPDESPGGPGHALVSALQRLGRLSVPADIATAVLLLGSPANGNITGAYPPVVGGID